MAQKVVIYTATVGQCFGTVGVAKRGRQRLVTADVYPLGFETAPREAAHQLAVGAGWLEADRG